MELANSIAYSSRLKPNFAGPQLTDQVPVIYPTPFFNDKRSRALARRRNRSLDG
jgi:hypothetical protein